MAGIFLAAQALFLCQGWLDEQLNEAWTQLPLDDAWIHLAYAKNLLRYGYFTYNPGQVETGSTSPLWSLLLAAGLAVLRQPVLTAKLLGLGLGAATAALAYRELRRLSGPVAAWTGALCLAITPRWLMGVASGMEIPLTACLLLLAVRQAALGRPRRTGLMLGLLILSRPDMAPPAAACGLLLLASLPRDGQSRGRAWLAAGARCAGVAILVAGAWFLYCRLGTGHWLPNTFYVKADRTTPFLLKEKLWTFYCILGHNFWPTPLLHDPVGLAFLAMGVIVAVGAIRRQPALMAWAALPLLHAIGWTMISPNLAPEDTHAGKYLTFAFDRYYLPTYPLIFGVIALGVGALARGLRWLGARLQTGLAPRGDRLVRRGLAAAVALTLLAGHWAGWWTRVGLFWPMGEGLRFEWTATARYNNHACRSIHELQVRSSEWIAANLPPDAPLATQDAGAIRYFTNNPLVDLVGLNSHEFHFAADKPGWLRRHGVRYAALFPGSLFDPFYDFRLRPLQSFPWKDNVIALGNELVVNELEN